VTVCTAVSPEVALYADAHCNAAVCFEFSARRRSPLLSPSSTHCCTAACGGAQPLTLHLTPHTAAPQRAEELERIELEMRQRVAVSLERGKAAYAVGEYSECRPALS